MNDVEVVDVPMELMQKQFYEESRLLTEYANHILDSRLKAVTDDLDDARKWRLVARLFFGELLLNRGLLKSLSGTQKRMRQPLVEDVIIDEFMAAQWEMETT